MRLEHPNIVDFYGAGLTAVDDRLLPILMYEYISGGSVEDLFARKSEECGKTWRPPRVTSLSWCHQLLLALAFLHEQDTPVAHRDIKPANLLVSGDLKVVKLADFSLACQFDRKSRSVPHVAGSMRYMAPEVTSKMPYALDKADVFSAAITCWCLTHGPRPYHEMADPVSAMRLVRKGLRPTVKRGPDLERVLSAAWGEPRRRPSARTFSAWMGELLAKEKSSWRKSLLRTVKSSFGSTASASAFISCCAWRSGLAGGSVKQRLALGGLGGWVPEPQGCNLAWSRAPAERDSGHVILWKPTVA
eukprot:3595116-Rhodomonas_salina.1